VWKASGVPPIPWPTAVITWSHSEPGWTPAQTERHLDSVARLAAVLREHGVDVDVDLYHWHTGEDWTRWGPKAIRGADYVLVIATPSWRAAWEGTGNPTRGAGAAAEADVLRSIYNEDRDAFVGKVRLVVLPGDDGAQIPDGLAGPTRYLLSSLDPNGVRDLIRDLTGQQGYPRPPLGRVPVLPPELLAPPTSASTPAPGSGRAVERARLQAALRALPEPELGEGPHLPWFRARQRVLNQLAELDAADAPPDPAALRFEQLGQPVAVAWRDDWDPQARQGTATLAVHVLPVPPRPIPNRGLAQHGADLTGAVRELVGPVVGLAVCDDPDGVTVLIESQRRQHAWNAVRPGEPVGVRVHRSGQVSAWQTLPHDQMGPALDPATLPQTLADCLRFCASVSAPRGDIAVAVEIGPTMLVSLVAPGEFGNRSRASLGTSGDGPLRVEPDETVDTSALTANASSAAAVLAAAVMRAWQQR
jgi:TIR domain